MGNLTQSKQLAEFIKQHYAKSYNRQELERVLDKSLEKKQTQFEKAFAAELEKASKRSESFSAFAQAMEQSNRKVIEQIRLTRGSLAARAEKERQRGLIMFKKDLVDLQAKTKGMDPTKAAKEVREYIAKQTAATEAFEEHLAEKRRDIEKVGEYLARPATALRDAAAAMIRRGEEKGSVIMRRLGGALSFAMDPTKFAKEWAGKKGKQFAFAALMKTSSKFRARIAKKELERKLRDPAFMLKVTSQVIREVRDNKEKQTDAMASLTKATLAAFEELKNTQKQSSDMQEVDATMREEHSETLKALLEMLSEENKDEKKKDAELEKEESGFVASMENTINDKMSFFTNHLLASLAEKLGINALKTIIRGLPRLISGAVVTALTNPVVLIGLAAAVAAYKMTSDIVKNSGAKSEKESRVAIDAANKKSEEVFRELLGDIDEETIKAIKKRNEQRIADAEAAGEKMKGSVAASTEMGIGGPSSYGLRNIAGSLGKKMEMDAAEEAAGFSEDISAVSAGLVQAQKYLNSKAEDRQAMAKEGRAGFATESGWIQKADSSKIIRDTNLLKGDVEKIKDEYAIITQILNEKKIGDLLNLAMSKGPVKLDQTKILQEIAKINKANIDSGKDVLTTVQVAEKLVEIIERQFTPNVEPTKEITEPTTELSAQSFVSPGVKEIFIKKETEALNVDKLSNSTNQLSKTMKALPKKTQQIGVQNK